MESKPSTKLHMRTVEICFIAMMSALICVCSWINITVTAVPFTMQTFAVFLSLLMFDAKGLLSILVYILLGAVGLPVFSGFEGGLGKLFGPTGGFIFGFILCAGIYLLIQKIFGNKDIFCVVGMIIGLIGCYLMGTLQFMLVTHTFTTKGFVSALSVCVLPFIIPDLLKMLLAYVIYKRTKGLKTKLT